MDNVFAQDPLKFIPPYYGRNIRNIEKALKQ